MITFVWTGRRDRNVRKLSIAGAKGTPSFSGSNIEVNNKGERSEEGVKKVTDIRLTAYFNRE